MTIKKNNEKDLRAERFVASLLALTSFGSYNKRVSGSAHSVRLSPNFAPLSLCKTSDTRQPLGESFKKREGIKQL
jgi:hypothetical protein